MAPSALVRQSAAWRQQPAANGAWSKVCLSEIGFSRVSPADNPKWTWLPNRSKRGGHSEGAKAFRIWRCRENEESDHKLLDRFGKGPDAPQQHGTLELLNPEALGPAHNQAGHTLRNCQDMAADFGFSPGHHSCYQLSILYVYIIY